MKWVKFVGIALGILGGVMASLGELPDAKEALNDAKNSKSESKEGEA